MKSLSRRIAKIERATDSASQIQALHVVHGVDKHPDDFVGVWGLNVPLRAPSETFDELMQRLESHVRQTRGRALPFVGVARYCTDSDDD